MLNDKVVAFIKTVVPGLWASLVAWIVTQVALPGLLVDYLNHPLTIALVLGGALAGWKALWDWANPYIPDWVSRIVLGSAQTATYVTPPAVVRDQDGVKVIESDVPSDEELVYDETE